MLKYDNDFNDIDLLSKMYHEVRRPIDEDDREGWCWYDTVSDQYGEIVAAGSVKRCCSPEHLQRFSWRFLTELEYRMEQGVHGWSEQASPTLCLSLDFKYRAFDEDDLGVPYSWEGDIPEEEWSSICKSHEQCSGKLYHALKF